MKEAMKKQQEEFEQAQKYQEEIMEKIVTKFYQLEATHEESI